MAKKKNTMEAVSATNKPAGNRTSGSTTTASAPGTTPRVSHEQVAKRAYEIWVAKGRPAGRDLENWQQAERELGLRR